MNFDIRRALTLLTEKIMLWYEMAIKSIPNIIVAILVFILFLLIARFVKNVAGKLLSRVTQNEAVKNLLRTVIYFIILALGTFTSLEIMNLEKTVTSILAGAGVLGLALGFAFQEIASNFVAGILIAFKEPYQLEDIVEINDYFGSVTDINLRTTSITTFQGLEVIIPNKDMFTKPFINYTTTPKRRLDINIGVSYSDDLKKVEEITKSSLENITGRIKGMDIEVFFQEFGDSSINLSARVWVNYPGNQTFLIAQHEAIMSIKNNYDKNNITIPFPIRTLDFGAKGSKDLGKVLSK